MGTCNCKNNDENKNEIDFYKMKDLSKIIFYFKIFKIS